MLSVQTTTWMPLIGMKHVYPFRKGKSAKILFPHTNQWPKHWNFSNKRLFRLVIRRKFAPLGIDMPINVINVLQIGLYECFYIPQRNYEAIDNQCRHDFFWPKIRCLIYHIEMWTIFLLSLILNCCSMSCSLIKWI